MTSRIRVRIGELEVEYEGPAEEMAYALEFYLFERYDGGSLAVDLEEAAGPRVTIGDLVLKVNGKEIETC